jgi:hypothetical protein
MYTCNMVAQKWYPITTPSRWMISSLVVRASDCQCRSRNSPGFNPSILRHRGIWGAADEAVLNTVHRRRKKIQQNPPVNSFSVSNYILYLSNNRHYVLLRTHQFFRRQYIVYIIKSLFSLCASPCVSVNAWCAWLSWFIAYRGEAMQQWRHKVSNSRQHSCFISKTTVARWPVLRPHKNCRGRQKS